MIRAKNKGRHAKALVPTLPTPRRASVRTFVSMAADKKDDAAVVILMGGTGSMKADGRSSSCHCEAR